MPDPLSPIRPRRIIVQVTDRCNARCRHCGYHGGERSTGRIDLKSVDAFVEAFTHRWGAPEKSGLTGGEPMLYPGLTRDLIRRIARQGSVVRLLTNASWATSAQEALQGVEKLMKAGLSGFWISAGVFHNEHVPEEFTQHLVFASERLGVPYYLNFTYLHPLEKAVRSRGLPRIDGQIADDVQTLKLHKQFADSHPAGTHGWARVWDIGRASGLIDTLGKAKARRIRKDLARAVEKGEGGLLDLVGLGLGNTVFFRETTLGRSPSGRFTRLLARIHPVTAPS